MVLTSNLQYYSPIMLKYILQLLWKCCWRLQKLALLNSHQPLKLQSILLNQGNTKVLALFIARAGQTKTFDKALVLTLFLNVARILRVSEPQLSFLWCQAVVWLESPMEGTFRGFVFGFYLSFWHQKPCMFHTVKQHCLQTETAPTL